MWTTPANKNKTIFSIPWWKHLQARYTFGNLPFDWSKYTHTHTHGANTNLCDTGWKYLLTKTDNCIPWCCSRLLRWPHSVCRVCFSLNESTSYLKKTCLIPEIECLIIVIPFIKNMKEKKLILYYLCGIFCNNWC